MYLPSGRAKVTLETGMEMEGKLCCMLTVYRFAYIHDKCLVCAKCPVRGRFRKKIGGGTKENFAN